LSVYLDLSPRGIAPSPFAAFKNGDQAGNGNQANRLPPIH
jgi:hypothetical protein